MRNAHVRCFVGLRLRSLALNGTPASSGMADASAPIAPQGASHLKPLRILLYVLTVVTAAAALYLDEPLVGATQRRALTPVWLFTPLALYGVFFLAYAIDRWMLVRKRGYPAGRAFFQVVFGVVFALMLLPSTIRDWRAMQPDGIARLLAHPDVEIRVVTLEALGFRGFEPSRVRMVLAHFNDDDPRVQTAARAVLARWSGHKPDDLAGIRLWASRVSEVSTSTTGKESR